MSFSVRTDRTLIRATGGSRRFVRVEMQAPDAPPREGRLPVNLAFVLDRSGSMHGSKIERAREAAQHGIRSLREEDRFAVVAYDDQVDVIVPSTAATAGAREAAAAAVGRLEARGSTDLCGGWLRGCEQVGAALGEDAVGRCLLLTDGLANQGITDHGEIARHATALRERHVVTTTFGVGADFDETLLRRVADAGGGNFYFVESARQIPDFIAGEVGEALEVTAREVALVVEAGEGATVESLNDFPCRRDGTTWRVELGDLFSGQTLDPVLRLSFPAGETGRVHEVEVRAEDRDHALGDATTRLTYTWASDQENDGQPRDIAVARRVAALEVARATQDALERNRAGEFDAARELLEACAARLREYAGDDEEILAIVSGLERQRRTVSRAMSSLSRKAQYTASSRALKSKPMYSRRMREAAPAITLLAEGRFRDLVDAVRVPLASADPRLFGNLRVEEMEDPSPEPAATVLTPSEERALGRRAEELVPDASVRIVFTRHRLGDNWFSHWHAGERTAVVSLADWDGIFDVSPVAFLAFETLHHGVRAIAPDFDPVRLAHAETRGCLFDFCETRADVEIKLQAADLCPECRAGLEAAGLSVDRFLHLTEAIRALATNTPQTVH